LSSEEEQRTLAQIDQLILDVKAISLLHQSDAYLREALMTAFAGSPDEDVHRFLRLIEPGRTPSRRGQLLIALGELVFSSLLIFAGLIALVPSLAGLSTPKQMLAYVLSSVLASADIVFLSPFLSVIEFGFAIILLLSAFYLLRQASQNLKAAGFTLERHDQ
jgi:hypothetical protein